MDIKYRIQARHLEHVLYFLCRTGELQLPAGSMQRRMASHEFADAGAIDEFDGRQIQDDFRLPLTHQAANDVAENDVSLTERDFSTDIYDAHSVDFARCGRCFETGAILNAESHSIEDGAGRACHVVVVRLHDDQRATVLQYLAEERCVLIVGHWLWHGAICCRGFCDYRAHSGASQSKQSRRAD